MTKELLSRAMRVVVLCSAIALLGFAWTTHLQNRDLREFTGELLRARQYPPLLTGLKLDLLGESTVLASTPDLLPIPPQQRLVLVSSDECGFCKENLPAWEDLLDGLELGTGQEVWFVTFNTAELSRTLVERLEQARIDYRVLKIDDPILFSVRTGIVGVPATLVLGDDSTIELVLSGGLTDREIGIFQDHLNGKALPRRAFLTSSKPEINTFY